MNTSSFRVRLAVASAVGACVLALASPALAGGRGGGKKGGGGSSGSSSLSLVMVTDTNANGLPNHADTVTFNVSTTQTVYPFVSLSCYQNGALVYGTQAGFYPSFPWPWAVNMTLSSYNWASGAADCTAVLSGATTLATLNFHVGA